MSVLVFSWFYVFLIFSNSVFGITTKTIPLILSNYSDNSQYVQIRTNTNHGSRNLLQPHKNSLSPAQQSHILDDVQKNQRIHYHAGGPANLDDRQKSLFGSQAQTSPQSAFDQSHLKYANYLNLNSLSPPPIQTVVLSPQQTLPTTASHSDHVSYIRSGTHTTSKSSSPQSHSFNPPPLSQIDPLPISQEYPSIQELSANQKTHYYQPAVSSNLVHGGKSYATTPSSQFPLFAKSDSINAYSLAPNFGSKINSTAGIYSSLLEKPTSAYQDKIIKEIVIKANPEELIAKDRQKFFQQLLEENKNSDDLPLHSPDDQTVAQNDLSAFRGQFESELLKQLGGNTVSMAQMPDLGLLVNSSNPISEFSLPDGQKIQISKDYNQLLTHEDGGKIKAIVVKQYPTTTASPNLLEELTKGVIPPGTDFEVIKRNKDGDLEEVGNLPANLPQKKVTFVILEEQSDGSVKVQGVRGSEKDATQDSGEDVDTIIRKIKEGELKLPQSTRLSTKPSQKSSSADKTKHNRSRSDEDTKSKRKASSSDNAVRLLKRKEPHQEKHFVPTPLLQPTTTSASLSHAFFTPTPATNDLPYQFVSSPNTYFHGDNSVLASTPSYVTSNFDSHNSIESEPWNVASPSTQPSTVYDSSTRSSIADDFGLFHLNNSGYIANLFTALKNPSNTKLSSVEPVGQNIVQYPLLPTTSGSTVVEKVRVHNNRPNNFTFKTPQVQSTHTRVNNTIKIPISTTERTREDSTSSLYNKLKRDRLVTRKTTKKPIKDARKDNEEEESTVEETKTEEPVNSSNSTLSDILKKEGFFAMARFLRQSGLDSILNDTGPFTLFIPTDKAFRTLLIQLGGPDKAEEKFRENPRLLSGLLLHHVIPGAFRVNTLQDEMTGVSLAGTQLRVNTYTTHDIEWNDITVVTVNGAKILEEKDIVIPQGIAHAIDRVMFPLPVGNLLQSLQADRENRYSNFLKIVEGSELSYLLTGGKTFTLFAPLNRAFTHAEFTKVVSDSNESKSFVLRHLVPGALYSAGMKYYQVRDSMDDGQQVTLYKEAGKIKVNSAHVITRNIPATNGVIHAIDAFL